MTDGAPADPQRSGGHGVTFAEAFGVWLRIALLSFGGPAGQIAVMHRILVDERRWIGESRFLHALNYCMLLPGPEAQQLATYIGWLMHRTRGGIMAGTLFVLPGAVAIMVLSWIYVLFGSLGVVAGFFFGLKAAVLAIVLQAVIRVGSRALRSRTLVAIAVLAFIAIFLLRWPFPLIILTAAVAGFVGVRLGVPGLQVGGHAGAGAGLADADSLLGEALPDHARPSVGTALSIAAVWLVLWLVPVALLIGLLGPADTFTRIALFFSQLAMVTFGGAYAVLAWVAQAAVEQFGWVSAGEMLDGLGMAETTPGPLIMVTQFVGFLAAWRDPGSLHPLVAGTLGGLLTTWVTFVPCFLWIFLGAPFVETLRNHAALRGALSAVTAAVVGVILNLGLWFALHTGFQRTETWHGPGITDDIPVWASASFWAIGLALTATVAVFRFRAGILATLAASAAAGVALQFAGVLPAGG